MKVGINTAVYETEVHNGASQLECLKTLATRDDVNAVEVRGEFFQEATKLTELTAIKALCDQQGWALYYSVPEELFGPTSVNASLAANLKLADQLGITALKYSFGVQPELSATALTALKTLLKQTNVAVTIENQPNQNGVLTTFKRNLDWIQAQGLTLGYTFDSGNWYWINQQPEAAFDELKAAITVFHLKDIRDQTTVMLGHGATDWQRLLHDLPTTTPVFLEYGITAAALPGQVELVKRALS